MLEELESITILKTMAKSCRTMGNVELAAELEHVISLIHKEMAGFVVGLHTHKKDAEFGRED